MYIVQYDIKDKGREEAFLSSLKTLGDSNLFLSHSFFLDSESSRGDIYDKLRATMAQEDLLIIVETEATNMSGWLPKRSVDWIRALLAK